MKRITRGVQELNSKGLIGTVEEIKNGGLGSMYKDLSPQIQRCNVCSLKENSRLNKTLHPNVAAAADYECWGVHNPLATSIMDPNTIHGPTAQKMGLQQIDRFWTFTCFDDSRRLRKNLGIKLVPLKAP